MLTNRPRRDRQRLGIIPLKRGIFGLPGLARAARRADLVICGCGGLFQDDDSLLKMPYWALRLAFIRLFARRIVGLSIGAGPLDHAVSRLFGRLALMTLHSISVRDPLAKDVLQKLTRKTITVVPDPAFALQAASGSLGRNVLREAGIPADVRLVGVAVRRWFHTNSNFVPHKYAARLRLYRNRGRAQMASFVDSTARVLNNTIAGSAVHIVFMPTYNVDHENDAAVCQAIGEKLPPGSFTILDLDDPGLYKAVTANLSVMLCGRMHPAILAASAGTPVVGMAYNQKFFGMFSMLGQPQRCLCMTDFIHVDVIARLTAMLREAIDYPERFKPDTRALEQQTCRFIKSLIAPPAAVRARHAAAQIDRS